MAGILRAPQIIAALMSASVLLCFALRAEAEPQPKLGHAPQRFAQNEAPQPRPQQPPPKASQPIVPSDDVLLTLIRATLIALNQANATGNYTVLRDLGAPGFKEANSADKLAQIFASMRQRGPDLSLILLVQPKLYRKPEITPRGMLRITGFFPTDSERVNFDLIYQAVQGRWRLFGISAKAAEPTPPNLEVEAVRPPEAAASAKPPPAKEPEKSKTTATSSTTKAPSASETDIRDRLDNPPPPPPEEKKPEGSFWNPFAR